MTDEDDLSLAIARFPLIDWCIAAGGSEEGSDEYILTCPHCGKTKLSVNVERRVWRCFFCEERGAPGYDGKQRIVHGGGGIFKLIEWFGMPRSQVARYIRDAANIARHAAASGYIPEISLKSAPVARFPTGLPENCFAIPTQLPYMQRRNITLEDARLFGLGWVPPGFGWLANRLIFPVWDRGTCLFWQARAMWEEDEHFPRPWTDRDGKYHDDRFRKSLNPATERNGVHYLGKSDVVFNLEQAARHPRVAVTEGPISAMACGPSGTAVFGKVLHPAQLTRLLEAGVRAVDLILDGPKKPDGSDSQGAREEAKQAAAMMAPLLDVRVVLLPKGDPANWTRDAIDHFRAHATPAGLVRW